MAEGAAIDRMAVVVAQWPVGTIPADAFIAKPIDPTDLCRALRQILYAPR